MVAPSLRTHRQVRRLLDPLVVAAAATPDADRYRKSFSALAHIWVLLQHVLWGSISLSITYAQLELNQRWWQRWRHGHQFQPVGTLIHQPSQHLF